MCDSEFFPQHGFYTSYFSVTLGKCRNGLRGKVFGGSTHHVRDAYMARVLNLFRWELVAVDSHVLVDQDTEVDGDCKWVQPSNTNPLVTRHGIPKVSKCHTTAPSFGDQAQIPKPRGSISHEIH